MQIGSGLKMKDGKINKAVVSRPSSSVRIEQPERDTHSNKEEGSAPVLPLPWKKADKLLTQSLCVDERDN